MSLHHPVPLSLKLLISTNLQISRSYFRKPLSISGRTVCLHSTSLCCETWNLSKVSWIVMLYRNFSSKLTFENFSSVSTTRCRHTTRIRNTRQHSATHCNTLQHTATHCNTITLGNVFQRFNDTVLSRDSHSLHWKDILKRQLAAEFPL